MAVMTLLAWLAFVMSRTLQRRKVPELVGFIVAGIVVGPSGAGLLDDSDLTGLRPVTEFALAALMFLVGERLSLRAVRAGRWIAATGVISYVLSGVLVGGVAWALGADPVVVLLLSVLGGAAAPMTMASVTASARARGPMASGLIGSHAVSDALAALAFAVAIPAAAVLQGSGTVESAVRDSLRLGVGAIVVGVAFGLVVTRLARHVESGGELLVLALVHLLVAATVANALEVALPLAALVMGATVAGTRQVDVAQHLFAAVRTIEQPLYLVFFALAGAAIHLDEVAALGLVGVGYIAARALGRVGGGFLGGVIGGLRPGVAARVGADLLPQAGVAVALAVLAAEMLGEAGRGGATIVLGSVVFFELIGPMIVVRTLDGLTHDQPAVVDERIPQSVLFATMGGLDVPAWILSWCAQNGSELTVLAPGPGRSDGEDPSLDLLRDRCSEEGIPLRWRPSADDVDFASDITAAAQELQADLCAIVVPHLDDPERWMRCGPVERLANRLEAPVVMLPGVNAPAPDPAVRG